MTAEVLNSLSLKMSVLKLEGHSMWTWLKGLTL